MFEQLGVCVCRVEFVFRLGVWVSRVCVCVCVCVEGDITNHRTRAESQRIVAARPLCRLQYPVRSKSSTKDLPQ